MIGTKLVNILEMEMFYVLKWIGKFGKIDHICLVFSSSPLGQIQVLEPKNQIYNEKQNHFIIFYFSGYFEVNTRRMLVIIDTVMLSFSQYRRKGDLGQCPSLSAMSLTILQLNSATATTVMHDLGQYMRKYSTSVTILQELWAVRYCLGCRRAGAHCLGVEQSGSCH